MEGLTMIKQKEDMTREVRNYTDIFNIKKFMIDSIAPQYFDTEEINQFNVGLLGYTTELHAVTVEDTFNTMDTLIHEMFETRAILPSTLYTRASILGVDGYITANPSTTTGTIHIKKDDILKYAERREDEYVFVVDNDTTIEVDNVPYMFDYDIVITAREYKGGHIFTSRFNMTYDNKISDIRHPYIRTYIIEHGRTEYVAVTVPIRQVQKKKISELMISSDSISFPVINIHHSDMFAGMNVFYKDPSEDKYIQLEGRLLGGTPSRNPFYFYTLRGEDHVEISFTTIDRYFKPAYNSEIYVEFYTTRGEKGNYKKYTGQNIRVIGRSDHYDYNNAKSVMFAVVTGSSKYGTNRLSLEQLRNAIVEKNATSGAYNTEDDLQLYLNNYTEIDNSFVRFIKKRDDIISRLFSGYILVKDKKEDYFQTNTIDIHMPFDHFDVVEEVKGRHIIKSGGIFKYRGDSFIGEKIEGSVTSTDVPEGMDEFTYTNPFLITYSKNPSYLGYYLNSINAYLPMDFTMANNKATTQFVVNGISVKRNAIKGDDKYILSVNFKPTNKTISVDVEDVNIASDRVKCILTVKNSVGDDSVAYPMTLESFDEEDQMFTFTTEIETNDSIVDSKRFSCMNPYSMRTKIIEPDYPIPMEAEVSINILTKEEEVQGHKFDFIEGYEDYTLANVYTTVSEKVAFIKPLTMIQSQTKYIPVKGEHKFELLIEHMPLLGLVRAKDNEMVDMFIDEIHHIHDYLQGIIHKKTTNYSIDLKFYNTYGRSRNFTVGEDEETLNRTNSDIYIQVRPTVGVDVDELFRDIRMYIKRYIEDANKNKDENINIQGYNPIYISNLIQELENEIPEMNYMIFRSLNGYPSHIQVIENKTKDLKELTSDERRSYVPEYLTIGIDDIRIDLLSR